MELLAKVFYFTEVKGVNTVDKILLALHFFLSLKISLEAASRNQTFQTTKEVQHALSAARLRSGAR